MCMKFMYPWQKIPRWSLTGKTVYKVMKKDATQPTLCYSAHRKHAYIIGEEHNSIIDTDSYGDVTYGLHSFTYISDAINELNRIRLSEFFSYDERPESKYAIFECRIPTGARYYRGVWEAEFPWKKIPNIVSNRLIIVKEIVLDEDIAMLKAWDATMTAFAADIKNFSSN